MISQVILIVLIEFTLMKLHKQVYPSCLVNIERDYLSIDKRYPRLFISPEFSKVHTDTVCLSGNNYYWGYYQFSRIYLNNLMLDFFKNKIS
jgi:hypothetical protein